MTGRFYSVHSQTPSISTSLGQSFVHIDKAPSPAAVPAPRLYLGV